MPAAHRLFWIFCSLVALWPSCPQAAMVKGILLTDSGPLAGAQVMAYGSYQDLAAQAPVAVSSAMKKKGQYQLSLPPGTYYFTATGTTADGRSFFSYHGLNPIVLTNDDRWLPFFLVPAHAPQITKDGPGIGGQVLYKGQPMDSGSVSVYPIDDHYFRGMGLLTNSLDPEGRFWFDLEPGRYVVIARHHRQGSEMGPLQRGDLFCYANANPITVTEQQAVTVKLACYPRDGLNDFLGDPDLDPRGRREPQRRAASFWRKTIKEGEGLPGNLTTGPVPLNGKVIDQQGNAVAGLYVAAYPAENFPLFQMYLLRLIPPHITTTGMAGEFTLQLSPGSYYLVARQQLGLAPTAGELYGLFEGSANHDIHINGQGTNQATIPVAPIMPAMGKQ